MLKCSETNPVTAPESGWLRVRNIDSWIAAPSTRPLPRKRSGPWVPMIEAFQSL